MENVQEMAITSPVQSQPAKVLDCKTPPANQQVDAETQNLRKELRKSTTPDPLKVPKGSNYPERYRSPTDLMMSPVTKGLLARNRRGGVLLPPTMHQIKVQEMQVQGVVSLKIEI